MAAAASGSPSSIRCFRRPSMVSLNSKMMTKSASAPRSPQRGSKFLVLLAAIVFLIGLEYATYQLRLGANNAPTAQFPPESGQLVVEDGTGTNNFQIDPNLRGTSAGTRGGARDILLEGEALFMANGIGDSTTASAAATEKPMSPTAFADNNKRPMMPSRYAKANRTRHSNNTTASSHLNNNNASIPHRLFFTYKHNILSNRTATPELYDNIRNTIKLYRDYWNDPKAPVTVLTDTNCRTLLGNVAPELLKHFNQETDGSYKADLCRVAALYKHGGYYLDVDLHVLEPVLLEDSIEFATAVSPWVAQVQDQNYTGLFFQAFLATKPNSTILKRAMTVMKHWYTEEIPFNKNDLMGPTTLRYAYDTMPHAPLPRHVRFLREDHLDEVEEMYPEYPRQTGSGCCCDWVVHDPTEQNVYFYSRLVTEKGFKCSVEGPPPPEEGQEGKLWGDDWVDDMYWSQVENDPFVHEPRTDDLLEYHDANYNNADAGKITLTEPEPEPDPFF